MYKKMFETPRKVSENVEFGPSMVEPCHNLSLEELIRDYTRGIVHTERVAYYDDGVDVPDEPIVVPSDISEVMPKSGRPAHSAPAASASAAKDVRADEGGEESAGENGDAAAALGERGSGE